MLGGIEVEFVSLLRVEHHSLSLLVAVAKVAIAFKASHGDGFLEIEDGILEFALGLVHIAEGIDGIDTTVVGGLFQP